MVGNRIKLLRNKLQLSQKKFGEKLHVSQSLINAIENNYREATDRIIEDICREYNVSKNWILHGVPPIFIDPLESMPIDEEIRELTKLLMQLSVEERNSIIEMIKTFNRDLRNENESNPN